MLNHKAGFLSKAGFLVRIRKVFTFLYKIQKIADSLFKNSDICITNQRV